MIRKKNKRRHGHGVVDNKPCQLEQRRKDDKSPSMPHHFTRLSSTLTTSRLTGKTAIVTGGSRGIGLAIATRLATRGANVLLLARNAELLAQNTSKLPIVSPTQKHSYIACDINDLNGLPTHLKHPQVRNTNILINCAGISQASLLARTTPELIQELITTNLTAPITLTKHLTRTLISNKPSSIINVSSVLGLKGMKGTSVYSATKAGLIGFTRSLAVELGPLQVRVNSIAPGLVDTAMGKGLHYDTALGGNVPMANVVDGVMSLLDNESITGQNLVVDSGFLC